MSRSNEAARRLSRRIAADPSGARYSPASRLMTLMDAPPPSFAAPPVTEVVIAARFKPVTLTLRTLGDVASSLADDGFVQEQQLPPYDAPAESFHRVPSMEGTRFELLLGPVGPRYWLLSQDGTELVQIQNNWFASNWRKVRPDEPYRRWSARWASFERSLQNFSSAVGAELEFDQIEVTYVNHIEASGVWGSHQDAWKVFNLLPSPSWSPFPPAWEAAEAVFRWVIQGDIPEPLGRLHATITPGWAASGEPVLVLNLTARGRPTAPGVAGVQGFADVAHEWIVRTFAGITTEEMHLQWRRES